MEPSAKYVTNTTRDYGGGAVIDLTKEIKNDLYVLDDAVDRTICYTSPAFTFYSLAHINECIDVFDSQIDTENSYGTIQASIYSRTLKDWTRTAPSTDIWSGYAICNVAGVNSYFWGYGGETVRGNINYARYGKSIDFNHMVFPMGNIEVMDKSVYDGIDYDTYPTSQYGSASTPTTHNINLKTLDDNQGDYYVNSFTPNTAYIWQPDNNTWVSSNLRPSLLIDGEDAGGAVALENPFLGFTGGLRMTAESQDGHVSKTGGGDSNKVYKNLNDGFTTHYCLGFTDNFTIRQTRFETFDDLNNWGQAKYIELYGTNVGTHKIYFEHQEIDLGDSVLCLQFNIEMMYSGWWVPPHVYCDFQVYMKGSTVSKYLACMGLYFTYDGSAPTDLTPLTLHTSDKVWLGAMNESGNTTGEWIKGIEIFNYTGYNKIGNTNNPDYNPSGGGGGDDDDPSDDQGWGGAYSGAGAFSKFYLCTATDLANLRTWFGGGGSGDQIPDGFDPMGQVLGLLQYPVSISGTALAPDEITFRSGKTVIHTGVNADRSTGGFLHINCGSVEIPRRMQQRGVPFLDFETTLEIYVPFCGTAPLDVQTCVGKTLTCDMYVATATGDVSAVIAAGGHPVAYMSGNMAESLPISSAGYGMYLAACKSTWGNGVSQVMNQLTGGTTDTLKNVNQAALNETLSYNQTGGWGHSELLAESYNNPRIGRAMAAAAGPAGAAAIGLIKTGLNVANAASTGYEQYKRVKNASYTSVSGSFTSCAAWNYPFTPYVKITRPHKQIPTGGRGDYKHTAAIPLVETKTLSGAPGLTTCVNPDVSGIANATAQEKDIIYRALVNGVIV